MVNPEIIALREKSEAQDKQLATQAREIAELRGNLQQLDKIIAATTRQSVWQLLALIITLCATITGGLAYQTSMIEKRIEQLDKGQTIRAEAIEKNINARFEDLKQEVRAQRR